MPAPDLNLDRWLQEQLFDLAPVRIAVIDKDFNVIRANKTFSDTFGAWQGRKCHEAYKGRNTVCPRCLASEAFEDGRPRESHEVGTDENGNITRYIKHTVPVVAADGSVPYLVEMSLDVTERDKLLRQNELLFEEVPCNMTLLDRDLRIVRANRRIKEKFGDVQGRFCYEVLKNHSTSCMVCPAKRSFEDGGVHTGHSTVINKHGEPVHLQVTTTPIGFGEEPDMVLEMAVDLSETLRLEEELRITHSFLENLIATSMDGIVAVNPEGEVVLINAAARHLLGLADTATLTGNQLVSLLPDGFLDEVKQIGPHCYLPDTLIHDLDGEEIPVRLVGIRLDSGKRFLGMAVFLQNRRRVKQLEAQKLEAERLAAVGQTVSGLAHGVKNLLTGLEGGMYMMRTGLKKDNRQRIDQGWGMLERNIERITTFVRDFLSFAKGRTITVDISDPVAIAKEVIEMYQMKAEESGTTLQLQVDGEIKEAPLDYEGMHECLTNLVGNAIDACQMSDTPQDSHVTLRVYETERAIVYEVSDDGLGMDYEVKKKIFTTFFTTKGLGGTGLGLLTTRRIIQEHGGTIQVESEPGQGTTFTVVLRRDRLPAITPKAEDSGDGALTSG